MKLYYVHLELTTIYKVKLNYQIAKHDQLEAIVEQKDYLQFLALVQRDTFVELMLFMLLLHLLMPAEITVFVQLAIIVHQVHQLRLLV